MSTIYQHGHTLREPFQPGVYMLTGINGIGKSTIVNEIAACQPEAVPIHASQELIRLFNGITREEMELLAPEEKLRRMVMHFTTIFEQKIEGNKAVVLDTHLLVPIRKSGELTYEDIWSDDYSPYTRSVVMLSADPANVREWRIEDERENGRKRNTNIEDIALDQEANLARFRELQASGALPETSLVVENTDSQLIVTRNMVEEIFCNAGHGQHSGFTAHSL